MARPGSVDAFLYMSQPIPKPPFSANVQRAALAPLAGPAYLAARPLSLSCGACGRADANAQNIQTRSHMIHDWPTYALMLQRLVGDGATAPTDCASMWLVLHKHGQPVALVADVLSARFSSLVDARQFEAAQSCGRLMIDAAQQTGSSATIAHARHLRYRLHAAQNEHAAAARELEASLALAPSSRPHLWVELARARYALKGEEAGALLGAAEGLEAALVLTPADKSKWDMLADAFHELGRANFSYVPRAIAACEQSARLAQP